MEDSSGTEWEAVVQYQRYFEVYDIRTAERITRMDMNQKLAEELGVKRWQIDAAVNLIDEGNTIPFISRYRKEVTGSLMMNS